MLLLLTSQPVTDSKKAELLDVVYIRLDGEHHRALYPGIVYQKKSIQIL